MLVLIVTFVFYAAVCLYALLNLPFTKIVFGIAAGILALVALLGLLGR